MAKFWRMQRDDPQRLIEWLKWRLDGSDRSTLRQQDLLRDGGYDLYRQVSQNPKKQQDLMRTAMKTHKALIEKELRLAGIS